MRIFFLFLGPRDLVLWGFVYVRFVVFTPCLAFVVFVACLAVAFVALFYLCYADAKIIFCVFWMKT